MPSAKRMASLAAAGTAGAAVVTALVLWLGEPSRDTVDMIVFAFRALMVIAVVLELLRRLGRRGE